MKKVVIDTSVIIDYTRSQKGVLLPLLKSKSQLYIPTIVITELWAGESMNKKGNLETAERLISGLTRVNLGENSAKNAGNLLRKNKEMGAVDAIVAASAINLGAKLATSNQKHFAKVKGLKLFKV